MGLHEDKDEQIHRTVMLTVLLCKQMKNHRLEMEISMLLRKNTQNQYIRHQ